MSHVSTPAFVLHRTAYGDNDLIVTHFTQGEGKISTIAKAAKNSRKRFGGALDLFTLANIVYGPGKGSKGLPVLQEASAVRQFDAIRTDIKKTAYASFWAEVILLSTEEREPQKEMFDLFGRVLSGLDSGQMSMGLAHLLFQMRFLVLAGMAPDLTQCVSCRMHLSRIAGARFFFDNASGGVLCPACATRKPLATPVSLGTIKPLSWLGQPDPAMAGRVRLPEAALSEGARILEGFLPFQLGIEPKSLRFLRQMAIF